MVSRGRELWQVVETSYGNSPIAFANDINRGCYVGWVGMLTSSRPEATHDEDKWLIISLGVWRVKRRGSNDGETSLLMVDLLIVCQELGCVALGIARTLVR